MIALQIALSLSCCYSLHLYESVSLPRVNVGLSALREVRLLLNKLNKQRPQRLTGDDSFSKKNSKCKSHSTWSIAGQLNRRLYIRLLFSRYIQSVDMDMSTVPTVWRVKVWQIYDERERAAEKRGGEKKPVLISSGLVFPAGISTERRAAAVARGDQSDSKQCSSLLLTHFHSCLFSYTVILFSPSYVPIHSIFLHSESSAWSELHHSFTGHWATIRPVVRVIKFLIKLSAKAIKHPS